jgi:hypothetical protein
MENSVRVLVIDDDETLPIIGGDLTMLGYESERATDLCRVRDVQSIVQ